MVNFFGALILLLIFGPVILAILAHWAIAVFLVLLPWILATAAIAGVAAGLTAGLVITRKLPPAPHPHQPISRWRM